MGSSSARTDTSPAMYSRTPPALAIRSAPLPATPTTVPRTESPGLSVARQRQCHRPPVVPVGSVPSATERCEAHFAEAPACGDDVVDQGGKQAVPRRSFDLLGDVGNGLLHPILDREPAANVDAHADHHFRRSVGPCQFDQDAGELAAVHQHVVRPFQVDSVKPVAEERIADSQSDDQAQRAELGRWTVHGNTDGHGQVASKGTQPGSASAPAPGGLDLGGHHPSRDTVGIDPAQQRRVRATDMGMHGEFTQPGHGRRRERLADRRGRQKIHVVVEDGLVADVHAERSQLLKASPVKSRYRRNATRRELLEDVAKCARSGLPEVH